MQFMRTVLYVLLFAIVAGSSCKKPQLEKPAAANPLLSIKLNPQFLGGAKADSVTATWKQGNIEKRINMQIKNDSLVAALDAFTEGQGDLMVRLFSHVKLSNQYFSEWVFKKAIVIEKTKALTYAGPQTFFDAAWLPRVLLKDAIGHEALLGLRPEDPYFLVKDLQQHVLRLSVEKSYWQTKGGVQQAGGGVFTCTAGCLNGSGDVENTQFFHFLPDQIGSRSWNHISLTVLYETDPNGGGWLLTLEHEP
jgi:hypothetical protein